MNKNLLFTALAATTLLFATSCQQDEVFVDGNETVVTFEVGTPEIATRAFSKGEKATKLQYAVYDAEFNYVDREGLHGTIDFNKQANVPLQLAAGKTYKVLFWADAYGNAQDAPYTVDFAALKMNVNYTGAVCNDEGRDAFYNLVTVEVGQANKTQEVTLTRPFAQLNIGTDDLDKLDGVSAAKTQVKVNVYNQLDLKTGFVTTGSTATPRTFTLADRPAETEAFPVNGYKYLAMNYLLVGKDKTVVDVEFSYGADVATAKTLTYSGIPVQPNYRTNIYGSLLTQGIDFDVEIEPDFNEPSIDNEYEYYEQDGVFVIVSANGLKQLAERMNNESELLDETIVLNQDIDLAVTTRATTSNWTPIGTEENPFTGTFNGNGYSIKNLNIVKSEAKEGKAYIGFFGYAKNATIKNVTFENVNLNIPCLDIDHSQGHIGAVAGSLEGTSTIENVTVKGDIKVEATFDANGASRVAVVAGGNSYGNVTMRNVHVNANDGSYLKANNNVGALAGQLQGQSVFENCSSNIDVTGKKFFAGGIIGLAAGNQVFTNCHTTGDVTITAGREGRAHDQYRVGGIAGGWADNVKTPCVLTNCSYTGTISGTNADGSVATPLDYLGYVGRGYTLTGCQGSTVIIDGISFVQKYNTADEAGKYDVTDAEGESVVAAGSKEDLPKDSNDKIDTKFDDNTVLLDDITVSATETNANSGYGATGATVTDGAVLDGKGNTLTVDDANGTWDCVIAARWGTIKNLTVKGAMRGIFMPGADGDVYIDNVIFEDVIYTFNSDGGNKNYGVYISNSTLNGWTSHSDVHKEVVYTNCSFGEGNGYKFCRPYGPTTFVGCDFVEGYRLEAIGKVVFENCTIGGETLTVENLATLVTSSSIANASVR
ncbi:MAG: hypothetical protein J6J06_07340 [Bacteroidaceae bacterium]|nr:hypothetical protein [Bacteroidaceae bacterium]